MKAIESLSVLESFGLKDMSLEEIESINGGSAISVGSCDKLSAIIKEPILSGVVARPDPIGTGPTGKETILSSTSQPSGPSSGSSSGK